MPTNKDKHLPPHLRTKKKGHQPKYLNKNGAFRHNIKSKKTDKILSLSNANVCSKCHEKIEWRKRYRKYKPLTQPSKCNICGQKNVKAAYHTICVSCAKSKKADNIIMNYRQKKFDQQQLSQKEQDPIAEKEENTNVIVVETTTTTNDDDDNSNKKKACAICVKAFAFDTNDDSDEDENGENDDGPKKKPSLRQRKTVERQKERAQEKKKESKKENNAEEENATVDENDNNNDYPFNEMAAGDNEILVGKAYQQSLLQET